MRIIVPISTRGRPLRLAGALHSLTTLQSGKHDVSYVVRVDSDDAATIWQLADLKATFGIETMLRPRLITLGQGWNECVEGREWDACAIIADKHLCLTPGWDEDIATLMGQNLPAARWNLLRAPLESALIISRKWHDTLGQVLPEWFPFWFSERWVVEVHQLAFGTGVPMVQNMPLTEPEFKTQNLRDLEFWFDFFARTRIVRLQEARLISQAFGRPMPQTTSLLAEMRRIDEWQKPRIKGYYKTRGGTASEPTEQYKEALRRARLWLADHALQQAEVAGAA